MADQEILDRVRRIETRVTRMGNHLGIDVGGSKPLWNPKLLRVDLSSPNCSMSECLGVIPPDQRRVPVNVFVGDQYLTTITHRPD